MEERVYTCTKEDCGETWTMDENGLVPEFSLKYGNWYGYWVHVSESCGCPQCEIDSDWRWVSSEKVNDSETKEEISN